MKFNSKNIVKYDISTILKSKCLNCNKICLYLSHGYKVYKMFFFDQVLNNVILEIISKLNRNF